MKTKIQDVVAGAAILENKMISQVAERIWQRDPGLWSTRPDVQQHILARLGWLDIVNWTQARLDRLVAFANHAREDGFTDTVLLGMGGSSLAPEVLSRILGTSPGYPRFSVLDTTAPDGILLVEHKLSLPKTLFIVSSKSGTTTETLTLMEYFYNRLKMEKDTPGENFVAITDAGSHLQYLANERSFREVFLAPADVGGRYSALSYFGMVPAALIGVDLDALVGAANDAADRTRPESSTDENIAAHVGAILGDLALAGRDKLVLFLSPRIAPLGPWIEQLIAESTGKKGQGIVPVVDDRLPALAHDDQVFVSVTSHAEGDWNDKEQLKQLCDLGHPVLQWTITNLEELGGEFFFWEFATAVAASRMGINPFDEPDVTDTKNATQSLLETAHRGTAVLDSSVLYRDDSMEWYGDGRYVDKTGGAHGCVNRLAMEARPGDYLAILAYLPQSPDTDTKLLQIRRLLEKRLKIVACLAYGPRYLHSSGQLHKGGPDTGLYLLITSEPDNDLAIPGKNYSFQQLIIAQAMGDFNVLRDRGRRVLRVHLRKPVQAGLAALCEAL